MGGGASKARLKHRTVRAADTERFVDAAARFVENAVMQRPMNMPPTIFARTFSDSMKEAHLEENWIRDAFREGIVTKDDLTDFLRSMYRAHKEKSPPVLARMLLWEVRVAIMVYGGRASVELSVEDARVRTHQSLIKEAESMADDPSQKKNLEKIWILEKSLNYIEDKFKTLTEELVENIANELTAIEDEMVVIWRKLLDPVDSGRLDAIRISSEMLYENAQLFAEATFRREKLVAPMKMCLENLSAFMARVPVHSLKEVVIDISTKLQGQLDRMLDAGDSFALFHEFVFPCACASPFLPPIAKNSSERLAGNRSLYADDNLFSTISTRHNEAEEVPLLIVDDEPSAATIRPTMDELTAPSAEPEAEAEDVSADPPPDQAAPEPEHIEVQNMDQE
mmetsp:Transcript_81530/g.231026  ORF Transcript_81530/g.231026 Transcript_81530/m.231026 type:complete len:395 (+) Transcript_81530:52-1236(+)